MVKGELKKAFDYPVEPLMIGGSFKQHFPTEGLD